jgi:hypothetical protein
MLNALSTIGANGTGVLATSGSDDVTRLWAWEGNQFLFAVPGRAPRPGLRAVPLPGFEPVVIAALGAGKLHAVPAAFLDLVKARAAMIRQAKTI